MKIWREMRGPPADHPYDSWIEYFQSDDPHHLGIYWSYIKSQAKAHQAPYEGSGQYVTIQASVDVDKINWKRTLLQHMDQDYHVLEKEIRLYKGTPLEIEKVWIDGEEYTTQDMEDKNMRRQFVASLQ